MALPKSNAAKDAAGIANSVDPDQTAPVGSGSALFAQTCLSENLGSLCYCFPTDPSGNEDFIN